MTRTASANGGTRFEGADDEPYTAFLLSAKKVPSKIEGWAPQLEVEWEGPKKATLRDWLPERPGTRGHPLRLRKLLNALAEKDPDAEPWFDLDTLEWGYDMAEGSAAYAKLVAGMRVQFRGENRSGKDSAKFYRITSYKAAAK